MTPLAQPPSREASGPNSKFCQKNISLFSQNIEWIGLRHILETYDRGCLTVDELFLTARSGILLLPRAMNCDGNAVSISVPPSLEENQRRCLDVSDVPLRFHRMVAEASRGKTFCAGPAGGIFISS